MSSQESSRRVFLKVLGAGAATAAASACGPTAPTSEEFFRQHYKKLTPEDKKQIFALAGRIRS